KRWSRSQAGEEDFIAFCDLLGYPPSKVLGWLHGEFLPDGPEVLSIAGTLGLEVYLVLDLPKPDPELIKIYGSFAHLTGQDRSNLALALIEVERVLKEDKISTKAPEAKEIIKNTFEKYGLNR
ncbi:MAG TPA: hypothetical protein PK613_21005, partial [Anaerolineaceae bacterium]|nr:hypothetical protein [Anaerolineaceae bacterium]